jgi:hypothetical protein
MALLELEKLRRDINTLFGYVKCLMAKEDETSPLVATEWSANHYTATGNPYTAGTYVFWNGHVYKCKFPNDGLPPTNTTYWLDLGEGHLLAEEQSDWNATGGRRFILNKPTNTSDFVNDGEDGSSPFVTQDELNAALPDPQNLDEVLAEGSSAPTREAYIKEIGLYDNENSPLETPGYATISASGFKTWFKDKTGLSIFNFSEGFINVFKGAFYFRLSFPTLTANRTATFQDKSGVVAYLSDISGSTSEEDPIFNAWLATNPLASFITTETDPAFTAWLATNPLNGKEDTSNKVASFTGNETSTSKFPVVKAIIDYFTSTQIKTILGISTLSGSNTGDQDLSGLVVKNTAITGATKTKVTYDSKGLITSGTDATTADINDSTDKRYVTDALLAIIGTIAQSGQGTYAGTITWTAGAAPSGTTNFSYNWIKIGNLAALNISLFYSTAGTTVTAVTLTLPPGAPTPIKPPGFTGALNTLYQATGKISAGATSTTTVATHAVLRSNAANTGFEIYIGQTSGTSAIVTVSVIYFSA